MTNDSVDDCSHCLYLDLNDQKKTGANSDNDFISKKKQIRLEYKGEKKIWGGF